VQQFTFAAPPREGNVPTATWTSKATGGTAPLLISGTASDDTAVLKVEVQVKNNATGLFWNGLSTLWGPGAWNQAILSGPPRAGTWQYSLVPALPGGSYTVKARAYDAAGNVSKVITRTFTVAR
jgi:hypothetical protein